MSCSMKYPHETRFSDLHFVVCWASSQDQCNLYSKTLPEQILSKLWPSEHYHLKPQYEAHHSNLALKWQVSAWWIAEERSNPSPAFSIYDEFHSQVAKDIPLLVEQVACLPKNKFSSEGRKQQYSSSCHVLVLPLQLLKDSLLYSIEFLFAIFLSTVFTWKE